MAEIAVQRTKFKPKKVKLKKTGGQKSKYFLGASLVCISDHFEQKFIGVRFFCIWVMTISKYHFGRNCGANDKIQTIKGQIKNNRRSEHKKFLWASLVYISDHFKLFFAGARFFCTWVMTISKYHFCRNFGAKDKIQT